MINFPKYTETRETFNNPYSLQLALNEENIKAISM